MRPLRAFTIKPSLPEQLAPLLELAHNLWWCWHGDAMELFRRIDAEAWESYYHNPVAMLGQMAQERLTELAHDEGFLAHLSWQSVTDAWGPRGSPPRLRPAERRFAPPWRPGRTKTPVLL